MGGPQCAGDGHQETPSVIVGEAPGGREVYTKVPLTGPSGDLLNKTLAVCGMPREQVYVTNAVMCRPVTKDGKDTAPTKEALRACSQRLVSELRSRKPKVVVAVGATAAQVLCNTTDPITKIQGSLIWNASIGCYVLPTYHPAAVL